MIPYNQSGSSSAAIAEVPAHSMLAQRVAAPQLAAAVASRRRILSAIALCLNRSVDNEKGMPIEVVAGGIAPEAPVPAGGLAFGTVGGHGSSHVAGQLDALAASMRPSADGEGLAVDDEWRALMMGTAVASTSGSASRETLEDGESRQ